jgi:hypothetical protein
MTVQELSRTLGLQTLCEPEPDREVEGGYTGDLLSWVMGNARSGDVWITIMSNNNVVAVAVLADTACVILTEGVRPDPGVLELAEKKGINLYSTEESSFTIGAKVAALL